MPDIFRLLNESFQDQPPPSEEDGFHDFNALSRIATPQPSVPETEEKRLRKPEVTANMLRDKLAPSIAEAASSPPVGSQSQAAPSAFVSQHPAEQTQIKQSPSSPKMKGGQGRAEIDHGPAVVTERGATCDPEQAWPMSRPVNTSTTQRPERGTTPPSGADISSWRQLSVADLLMRLRSGDPVKGHTQRRLSGMFRK